MRILCQKHVLTALLILVACLVCASEAWLPSFLRSKKCEWDASTLKNLELKINQQICGQPLAVRMLTRELEDHVTAQSRKDLGSSRPLVISIHGTPGSGKTTLVDLLTKNLKVSSYVPQQFSGSSTTLTSLQVSSTVVEQLEECSKRIFIFDEADKLQPEIIKYLVQFIEGDRRYLARNAVFIFAMNMGQDAILQYISSHVEEAENDRLVGPDLYKRLAPVYSFRKPINSTEDTMSSRIIKHANELHKSIFYNLLKVSTNSQSEVSTTEKSQHRGSMGSLSFFNELVTRKLIKHHLAFLHIARDDLRCCVELALRRWYDLKGYPIAFSDTSPYWSPEVINLMIDTSSLFEPIPGHEAFTKPGCRTANEVLTRTLGLLDLTGGEIITVENDRFIVSENKGKGSKREIARLQDEL